MEIEEKYNGLKSIKFENTGETNDYGPFTSRMAFQQT